MMSQGGGMPILVVNTNTKQEKGRHAQNSNIQAAKAVADTIRTCLGPRAMLKMLLDPMGGIVLTNDGNAILREVEVAHPAAKSMIELSRTQDEEVGDGTTSVIILAGEVLHVAAPFLTRNMHPVTLIDALQRGLQDALATLDKVSIVVDTNDDAIMTDLIQSALGTKYTSRWSSLMCSLALKAVRTVTIKEDGEGGRTEIDLKRYARIEKIPGGEVDECTVLSGIIIQKDVTHPKMSRRIENPRILLLDCPLEYKKGESQTNLEVKKEGDWTKFLEIEEEQIKELCADIINLKPDLVITEKGVSDLAQHYLHKANITVLRRVKKSDNNRIARCSGATIVNQASDATEADIGTGAGLFKVEKIGDEYFSFIVECKTPKACTILLRGPSRDLLNEIQRNLDDAMAVARNVIFDPRLVPGGGSAEMAISVALNQNAPNIDGTEQWAYKELGRAFEVIPRTLIQNCGGNVIKTLTELRAKHASGEATSWGINGITGEIADMKDTKILEPYVVKSQTIKTAIESACLLLRVDDIVSGISKKQQQRPSQAPQEENPEDMMAER